MTPPSTDVSPPPLKRRRISSPVPSDTPATSPHPTYQANPPPAISDSLTVYSWNINAITPFLPPSTPKITSFLQPTSNIRPSTQPSLRACLQRWSWPSIVALQEVKIALTDSKTQAAVKGAINAPLDTEDEEDTDRPLYDAHFCLPRDKHNATGFGGKVYGVCTLVHRKLQNASVRSVEWDLEGRVLICEMVEPKTAVINVYAVNGTSNDYRDPGSGKVIGNRHDRKRAFHSLLRDEVRGYETRGWNVVVAGDMNISRSQIDSFPRLRLQEEHVRNRADFEKKFFDELGMLDTFREVRDRERKYSYRPRGKPWGSGGDRVDMVLASRGMKSVLREADILDDEEARGPSDHVPLYVTLCSVEENDGETGM